MFFLWFFRSTTGGGPERGRLDKIDWGKGGGGGGNDADIALTVKLQQKLKELQTKNERLERQLNQTASSTPEAGKNTAGDNVKVEFSILTAISNSHLSFISFWHGTLNCINAHFIKGVVLKNCEFIPLNGHSSLPRCRSSNLRCSVDSPGKIH